MSQSVPNPSLQPAQGEQQDPCGLFRQLADSFHEAGWLTDLDGAHVLYVNPAYASIWGRASAALYETPGSWLEAVHAEDLDRVRLAAAAATNQQGFECKYRVLRSDGALRWVRHRGIPLRDAAGAVCAYSHLVEDYTQCKQAYEEFERLFNSSPDLMAIIGFDGYIKRMNTPTGLTDYISREVLCSQPLRNFIHPDDRERAQAKFAQIISEGGTHSFEVRCLKADGSYHWFWWCGTAYPDRRLIYATARDVNDRRLAEEALIMRARQQSAVAELGGRALTCDDLGQLVNDAAKSLAETLQLEYASVLELQADGSEFLIRAAHGLGPGFVEKLRVWAERDTLSGFILSSNEPVIVTDLRSEKRFRSAPLLHKYDITSGMACVIPNSERPYGVLAAFSTQRRKFTEDDVHFLQAVANILAGAVQRRQAHDEVDRFFTPAMNPMIIAGFDGYMKRVNHAAEVMSGYSREELLATPMLDSVHPEDRELVAEDFRNLEAGGSTTSIEFRLRSKDGSYKWTHWSASSFPESGVFYAIGYDVSDRYAAQRSLAERELEIHALLDSLAEGVFGIDLEGRCTFSNAACRRMLEYDAPEDLLGKTVHEILQHRSPDGTPMPVEDCPICRPLREERESHVSNELLRRRDGTSFPAEYWSYPVRRHGKVAGCVISFLDVSERVQAMAERDRFFNHPSTPMCVLGFDGHFRSMNPVCGSMFGYSREELLSQPFLTAVHPEDKERAAAEAAKMMRGDRSAEYEIRIVCKDGSHKWMAWSAAPFQEQQAFYAIGHDVTDRHLIQDALAEQARLASLRGAVGLALNSETTLRGMLEKCSEALVEHLGAAFARIWTLNPADNVLELQASAGLYTHVDGAHARIPVGQYKIGRIARDRKPHLTNAVVGDPLVHDQEWAKREGMTAFAGHPLLIDNRVVGVVGLFSRQKMSEASFAALAVVADAIALGIQRRRAEEERQNFVSLVENSNDFIGMAKLDGRVIYINDSGLQMTGLQRKAGALDLHIEDCHPDQWNRKLREEIFPQVLREGQYVGECQLLDRRTGNAIDVLMNLFLIRDSGTNEPLYFATVMRDIGDLKRNERDLVQAKEAAEAANRTKSEFLANMSHEIRTPMNGVIGLTSLVLDTPLNKEQRQYLDGVMLSAEALLRIINDILDFSKIEAGRLELEKLDFDLRETLGNTMGTLAVRAHEKGLELLYEVRPEAPDALVGDPARLWQVLVNLVGNAIKFTDQGEVSVTVAVESLQEDAVCLEFTVSDTGIGIPAEKQQTLFKPFSQVDSSMTRKYGGTGLGLAISAQLIEMMKGRIWVESELGKGSRFHFTAWFERRKTALPKRAPLPPSGLDGLRVLIVDDNATNRLILRNMLTHWGMRPAEADGGSAGLESLQAAGQAGDPFSLILLDVMMPVMDGVAVLERIRQMPEIDRPVIMMLSSRDQPEDSTRARALGAVAYIIKPVRPKDLLAAIVRALDISFEPEGEPSGAPPNVAESRGESLRILVAEDNPINQMLAVRLLQKAGHRAAVANNGEQALAALARENFDLVLMDVQMPVLDGFEATALIRQQEKGTGRRMPIIAMTAHAMKGDRERCLEAGMDGYVAKPVQRAELFDAIATVLPASPQCGDGRKTSRE